MRIAPPEAPVTGYMFGKVLLINLYYYKKGVYFADMVSKSANYCGASKENNEIITAFPGQYAPAFPIHLSDTKSKIASERFWEEHAFIEINK